MATAQLEPDVLTDVSYEHWFEEVRVALSTVNMQMELWQGNWPYDFRMDFEFGMGSDEAADHAHDFWWQHVLDECWT